nr:ribonuclease H-like domain-containing protein [Tanacetum cinerariifolium]
YRFAKTDSMKAVPPPLTGDYTSLSDHTDLDESQMSYGAKSSTSCDPKYMPNDFISCDDSDKSSEVNTNDFASGDSSVKSLEHKPTNSTSCASSSSVSTSVNEAEIESNVGTHIKELIIVQDLPSFTSVLLKTSKVHIPPVRPQPVPTGKPKVTPVLTGKPKATPVPTGKPKVTPVPTGKPKATPFPTSKQKVTPVPTGRPQVSTPVPTGRPNRPFPVPTYRGYTPSETPFSATEEEGIFDSGCSRSMTGSVTGKGTICTPTLDFENVYYVKELQQFNLFCISQICDKKNQVLFTDTECLILFKDFKLPDDSLVVLKVLRKHNLYTINLNDLYLRAHKDETYPIPKDFINLVENQLNKKVKAIRCDNVRTNCYVLNRVSVTSPHNKTPYALLTRNIPSADEGYIVGYSASNKSYRVYNVPNKRVEESMNLQFLKEKTNVQGLGHE